MYVNSLTHPQYSPLLTKNQEPMSIFQVRFLYLCTPPRGPPQTRWISSSKAIRALKALLVSAFLNWRVWKSKCQVLGILYYLLTNSNLDLLDFQQAISGYKVAYDEWADMTNFEVMDHLILSQEGYQNSDVYSHRVMAWQTEIRAWESSNLDSKTARRSSAEPRSAWRTFTISQRLNSSIYGSIVGMELKNFSHVLLITHNGGERNSI